MPKIVMGANKLYRTNCGAIMRSNYDCGTILVPLTGGCAEEECREFHLRNAEDSWLYTINGIWEGEDGDKSFHLHIREEILP